MTDASPPGQNETLRRCAWCPNPIPVDARRDSIYCSKRCRQAAHRFRRGYQPRPPADRPLTLAYADPPYPGTAKRYYEGHPDYAGEVDHQALVRRLDDEFPDGWALSTSAKALPAIIRLCPPDAWVAAWVRGSRPTRSSRPLNAWEPVIIRGGRQEPPPADAGPTSREDVLIYTARARTTEANRVTGAKPAAFLWWLFDLLGARPGDTLVDLYPGTGAVTRAWDIFTNGRPLPRDRATRRRRSRRDAQLELEAA